MRENQVDVLVDGIRRAAIPHRTELLLRRHHLDEFAELAAQVTPAVLHVLYERLRLVLREDGDLADTGVHAVGEYEIDDAELAAERGRGLAAMRRQVPQPLAPAARHDDGQRAACQAAHVTSGGGARWLTGRHGPTTTKAPRPAQPF
jgi:hypothetical protein